jgi:hypothetical protein
MFLHLIAIAWLYVAVMMSVAEATASNGTVLGAIITFVLYGLLPVALLMYLLATPMRRRLRREREAAEPGVGPGSGPVQAPSAIPPDGGSETAACPQAGGVAPVGKEPR